MDTNEPNAACAATTDFGLRQEAKRHAALEALSVVEKRCRRCALPPQSKFSSSVREVAGLYLRWTRNPNREMREIHEQNFKIYFSLRPFRAGTTFSL
jgi:hypothetical protein